MHMLHYNGTLGIKIHRDFGSPLFRLFLRFKEYKKETAATFLLQTAGFYLKVAHVKKYQYLPAIFWFLVITLLPHLCKILRPYGI